MYRFCDWYPFFKVLSKQFLAFWMAGFLEGFLITFAIVIVIYFLHQMVHCWRLGAISHFFLYHHIRSKLGLAATNQISKFFLNILVLVSIAKFGVNFLERYVHIQHFQVLTEKTRFGREPEGIKYRFRRIHKNDFYSVFL